jgi:hypothetical protein
LRIYRDTEGRSVSRIDGERAEEFTLFRKFGDFAK